MKRLFNSPVVMRRVNGWLAIFWVVMIPVSTYIAINRRKTACPQGHPYSPENTAMKRLSSGSMARVCITCRRTQDRARRAA